MSASPASREAVALPLCTGERGEAVTDLQQRLSDLGFPTKGDEPGNYSQGTADAVRSFQQQRGLVSHGTCDHDTWAALVEAGYRLGDRQIFRREPMLRGDDVAELQRRLSALGFDPGRIDGIFGDQSRVALADFQRNAGLLIDGICGRSTVTDLLRLQPREGSGELVSPLRERLRVATGGKRSLNGRHIGIGEQGGFPGGVVAVSRALRDAGAIALAIHHPDPSNQAVEANAAEVDCFISLVIAPEERTCTTAYYRGYRYESLASRHLAVAVQRELPRALGLRDGGVHGMALPILRETQMPAVELRLGAPVVVVQRTVELAQVLVSALEGWIQDSCD